MFDIKQKKLSDSLTAAIPFACTDSTREHLCTIAFQIVEGQLEVLATDGHTALRLRPLRGAGEWFGEDQGPHLLKLDDAKELAKRVKPDKSNREELVSVRLKFGQDEEGLSVPTEIAFLDENETALMKAIPEWSSYPPLEQVIPEKAQPRKKGEKRPQRAGYFAFNWHYMNRAMTAISKFTGWGKNATRGPILTTPEEELDPIRIDAQDPDAGDATVVVMPMRI